MVVRILGGRAECEPRFGRVCAAVLLCELRLEPDFFPGRQSVGAWLSLARAPGSGPGGRWFKSTRPDHSKILLVIGLRQLFC